MGLAPLLPSWLAHDHQQLTYFWAEERSDEALRSPIGRSILRSMRDYFKGQLIFHLGVLNLLEQAELFQKVAKISGRLGENCW